MGGFSIAMLNYQRVSTAERSNHHRDAAVSAESEQKVMNSINSVHAAEKDHGWGLKICWKTTAIAHVDSPGHPYCDWCILRHEDLSCNQIGLTWVCAKMLGTQQHGYTILKIWTNQICGFFLRGKKNCEFPDVFSAAKAAQPLLLPQFQGSRWEAPEEQLAGFILSS